MLTQPLRTRNTKSFRIVWIAQTEMVYDLNTEPHKLLTKKTKILDWA